VQEPPHQKAQISSRSAPKPITSSRHQAAARNEVRPKHERDNAGTSNLHSKPAFTDSPAGQPISAHSNDNALWTIRSRMSSRPKTSAAACVDYVGENSDPSSRPSNRTTYTTYSTPATSIGYTAAGGKRSYTQDEPAMPALDFYGSPALDFYGSPALNFYGSPSQGDSPSRDNAQVCAWMDEQSEHRHFQASNGFEYPANSLREFYPPLRPEEAEQLRRRMKRTSIRNKVQEYFRPASSASNAPQRSSVAGSIKNYIRPDSSSGSIRSIATNTSTRSRTLGHWSSIKRRLSNASRYSQRSNRGGAADRDPNLSGETEIDLNRPLPPLPGLDSYKEKKTHIASLMKKAQSAKIHSSPAADRIGSGYVVIPDSPTRRYSNHSISPNFNMSTASIGVTPTSLNASSFISESQSSLDRVQSRPYTAKAGITIGVSPLSQYTTAKTPLKKEGFAKRWGGKFSLGKRQKVVVAA
jgi:hypothetical protein